MSASNIKLKRSAVPGKIPTIEQLELGEFAVNTYDGRLYTKKNVGGVESIISFLASSASDTAVTLDSYIGDGTTFQFPISRMPKDENHVFITINGVSQHADTYSIGGQTVTFSESPLAGDEIEIRTFDLITTEVSIRDYNTYIYNANNQTIFSGVDINGKTLSYDLGKIEVYANGARLVTDVDYTAINGSSVTIAQPVTGTIEIVSLSRASFLDISGIQSNEAELTTVAANQVVDTFLPSQFRTVKYLIQMSAGTNYHATEVLLIHNGTIVFITEYGTIFTGVNLGEIDADISGGFVRLLVTPTNINTTVKTQRISVTV